MLRHGVEENRLSLHSEQLRCGWRLHHYIFTEVDELEVDLESAQSFDRLNAVVRQENVTDCPQTDRLHVLENLAGMAVPLVMEWVLMEMEV